jgi:ureidoglycolate dehydrogenase (NAD+)
MQRVKESNMRRFVAEALSTRNVPEEDARVVADVLVTANLCGVDSHGVVRLAHYVRRLENGTLAARPRIRFETTSPSTGILHGDDGLGHVVMHRACRHAAALAKDAGTGTVIVKSSSHFGIAGYYVRRLIEEGLIAMATTPSDALLIPFGGSKPFFGTNPLAIGFPAPLLDGRRLPPVVLDMATTQIPFGKIVLAQAEGKPIPSDWGFDEEGKPTSDPDRIVGLHPIAGPKGSGLAMIIDLFTSLLAGAAFGPHIAKMYREMEKKRGLAHFLCAWDLSRFRPLEEFQADLGRMITELHAMPPASGFDRVLYPGEIEGERMADRSQNGIPYDDGLLDELATLAKKLGITPPTEG